MPGTWTEIAVDGQPPSDMSGGVTLYEIYDGNAVHLTGRFNDTWQLDKDWSEPTHWMLWVGTDAPPPSGAGVGWNLAADFVTPSVFFTLMEVYDGSTTSLTAWFYNNWIYEVPGWTHWKLPTLADPPV